MIVKFLLYLIILVPRIYPFFQVASTKCMVGVECHNDSYRITSSVDLKGDTLYLPSGIVLSFSENGLFENGVLVGNNTSINAGRKLIFKNIEIVGDWNNREVYGEWCGLNEKNLDNNFSFKNLMALCYGEQLTELFVEKGLFYVSPEQESAPIIVPSNVYWHNKATIKMRPTNLSKYSIVLLNRVNNVTIDGGNFEGDVIDHFGKDGEWGHGIKCGGASNIVLKNFSSSYCWGDGIDLIEGKDGFGKPTINCNNIIIDNVKCLNNRRQGMSIEAASNVSISNCEFAYTGSPLFTKPGAGIDIEPWIGNSEKVWNIKIYNSNFHNNKGFDIQCEPNIKIMDHFKRDNNIELRANNLERMRIQYTKGIQLEGCFISKELKIQNTDGIAINTCKIREVIKGKNVINIKEYHNVISSMQNISSVLWEGVVILFFIVLGTFVYMRSE